MTSPADAGRLEQLAARIERFLGAEPRFFVEVVGLTGEGEYRDVLRAWGLVRERSALERDEEGRYLIRSAGTGGRS